ncbi:MAG TPA: DNRLRE domain-containing protein, partial [Candidatus Dormibacteraeota bacterium]
MHGRRAALALAVTVAFASLPAPPAAAAPSSPVRPVSAPASGPAAMPNPPQPAPQPHDAHLDPARSREVPTLSPNLRQFDNPDGSHTLRVGLGPLKGVDSAGAVGALDLSLTSGQDRRLRPVRTQVPVSIASVSGGRMASVELAPGRTATVEVAGMRSGVVPARTPGRAGESVRYDGALPDGTSVELRPLSDGVETTYVVGSARAASALTEQLTLPAGYSARQASGEIEILDGSGAVAGRWAGGAATDSSAHGAAAAVTLRLRQVRAGVATALVVVDAAWLADPKRVYPVRIDPAVVRQSSSQAGFGATYVDTVDGSSHWNGSDVAMGTWNGSEVARTLIRFPVSGIPANARIVGATMFLDEWWSSSCTARPMEAHRVTAGWSNDVRWSSQPAFAAGAESSANVASGWSASCPESWQQMDLSALVADWYYGRTAQNGVLLRAADETDTLGWKRFRGASTGTAPFVDVTYETYGTSPIAVNDADTQPPATIGPGFQGMTLTNQGTDAWPANGSYRVSYHLHRPDGTLIRDGVRTMLPSTVNPGQSLYLKANIETLPMGDYIVAWDMVQEGVTWFSGFGVSPVNRTYHSDQPPAQATLLSPANGLSLISLTPTLSASSTDPDGPHLQYLFRICTGSDAESGTCTDSGWIDASTWTVPRGTLTWGTVYHWHTWVRDNSPGPYGVVGPPAPFSYTPVLPVTQPAWAFGSDPYVNFERGVNTALGNYLYTTTDVSIPTVGTPLRLQRTYNSMDTDDGLGQNPGGGTYGFGKWFGVGWSSTYETNLVFDQAGNIQVDYPDGRREFLIANGDGSFQPAFGFVSAVTTVVDLTGGTSRVLFYDLRHRDQSLWRFRPDGRLDSVRDPQGHTVQLTWNAGSGHCCASVTIADQTSGRSLSVTFSAPGDQFGRVTSVASSPVTVNGSRQTPTWTYGYDAGGQLASACDPGGACTRYTNGGPGSRLTGIKRQAGNTVLTLTYDGSNRAATVKDGAGGATTYAYQATPASGAPAGSTKTTTVTDPLGRTTGSSYNQLNQLLQHVNADGTASTFTFDQHGFLSSTTDENGHTTSYAVDGGSNVTQSTDGAGAVTYRQYDAQNHLTAVLDPRSSGPTDPTYQTTYAYDAAGNLTGERTPAATTTWAYSQGTEPAVGGGTVPPNLLLTAADAMGHTTTYSYDAQGDLRRLVEPSGLVTDLTYDELGRQVSQRQTSDAFPNGLVSTTAYDVSGRVAALTEPPVANAITGLTHQRVATTTYDGNGNVASVTVSDATGGDVARRTTFAYDADDRQVSATDALGGTTATSYDAAGNVAQVRDALGRVTATSYTNRDQLSAARLLGFVDGGGHTRDLTLASFTYDATGQRATETDALGRVTRYDRDAAGRLVRTTLLGYHNADGSTRDVVLESRAYDPAGDLTRLVVGGGLRTTTYGYDAAGRLVSSAVAVSAAATRTTTYAYDASGNVLSTSLTDGTRTEQERYHYDLDQAGRQDRVTVVNGAAGDLVSTSTYDQRGLLTSSVDPRGNAAGA